MDPSVAAELAEVLPKADFARVMTMFLDEMRQVSAEIEIAAREADAVRFGRAAHQLAGAAGSVGAVSLEAVSRRAMTGVHAPAQMVALAVEICRLSQVALTEIARLIAVGPSA